MIVIVNMTSINGDFRQTYKLNKNTINNTFKMRRVRNILNYITADSCLEDGCGFYGRDGDGVSGGVEAVLISGVGDGYRYTFGRCVRVGSLLDEDLVGTVQCRLQLAGLLHQSAVSCLVAETHHTND